MNTEIKNIKIHTALWEHHHRELSAIRRTVFIEEQYVPEHDEWDGLDELISTTHFIATLDDMTVGTARLLSTGQIGRMCVLKPYRHLRIGRQLLTAILEHVSITNRATLFLNAQLAVIPFYQFFGFKTQGDIFDDAGIPHQKMIMRLEV